MGFAGLHPARLAHLIASAGKGNRGARARRHLIDKGGLATLLIAFGGTPQVVGPARSQLGNVVLRRHRFAGNQKLAHPRFEFLVGQRRARSLVQVVCP